MHHNSFIVFFYNKFFIQSDLFRIEIERECFKMYCLTRPNYNNEHERFSPPVGRLQRTPQNKGALQTDLSFDMLRTKSAAMVCYRKSSIDRYNTKIILIL